MPNATSNSDSTVLIENLQQARCYPHPVTDIQLLETHISWVLLAGEYAYKIKKPVNLGFLDFSTLEQRRQCCHEEVRLNRRFAPQIYLDCLPITGEVENPVVGGNGTPIEYAVRMRRFPQESIAGHLLAAGRLLPRHIDAFALLLAEFHRNAARATAGSEWGSSATILDAALQNIDALSVQLATPADASAIATLRAWTVREHGALRNLMAQRQAAGAIREGHGDLHLGNIVLIDDALVPFDCIEFSPALRWNDVLSEVAFLVMDLHDQGESRLAWLFLNAYLEHDGDYSGLGLLPFYLVYRALIRAKIAVLRATQMDDDPAARASLLQSARSYLALATTPGQTHHPALVITHGLSGSGKSRISSALTAQLGAIRLRTDIERKRLHGVRPLQRDGAAAGLYDESATAAAYRHLAGIAREILATGYSVIVDAACLQHWQRDLLRGAARAAGVPCLIVSITAPGAVLRERIRQRQADGGDPSDADLRVLEHQLQTREALDSGELDDAIELASGEQDPDACCQQAIAAINTRLTARSRV